MKGIADAIAIICKIVGELSIKDSGTPSENYLTFVISNGPIMIAVNGGITLYYSTHKKKCSERETCKSLAPWCEAMAEGVLDVGALVLH